MSLEAKMCSGCGKPIIDESCIEWNGHYYHDKHVPNYPPPMPSAPDTSKLVVLRVLQLIRDRALGNQRAEITLGDIEWAIQEIERG